MSEYQELIKSFQKSRNYVRDFLIYGFKSREDFSYKSGRTYDNKGAGLSPGCQNT